MNLLLPIATFLVSSLAGLSLILPLSIFREKTLAAAVGTVVGITLTTVITYLLTAFFLLTPTLITAVLILEAIYLVIANAKQKTWSAYKHLPTNRSAALVLIVLLFISALITPKLLFVDPSTGGGLGTGIINAYGDLGFHLANITNLAYNATIPPISPILAGHRLTYPFFPNFFSALLLVSGASYSQSVVWPAWLLIPLTLFLFYRLTLTLTSHPKSPLNMGSKAALIALLLFALGGGTFGWIRVINDLRIPHQSIPHLLANLPINYTGHSDDPLGFYLINPIISLLLPQRSFMFGMSLAFIILLLLLKPRPRQNSSYLLAGLLAGLLPLFHSHTVIALVPIIIALFLLQPGRGWLTFFITAAITGLPGLLFFLTSDATASASPHLQLGWMARGQNIFLFWLKNTGFILPVTIWGLLLPASKHLKAFALAGLLLFVSANIWLFAAWEWDNTKIFVYWLLFTLPLVAHTVIILWRKNKYYWRGVIAVVLIFHLFSGSIDVFRLTLPDTPAWPEWDQDSIALAKFIRDNTNRGDVILTAPYHNSPAALSGRSVYLGFPGHVWTHGGNHWEREGSISSFYTGQTSTLPQIQPQYVIVGPVEYSFYPELYLRPDWQLIYQQGSYSLYRLL